MATFAPGIVKTATITIKVTPTGVPMSVEVWLGLNPTTKAAFSGKIPFTSTGSNQTVACPVTMPSAAGTYNVYVDVYQGTTLVSSYVATEDVTITGAALVISNVVASTISDTGVTISWDLSDFGTGQVEYGTTPAYGQLSLKEYTFNFKHHDQVLSGLTAGTKYYFRVRSSNQAGIETVSDAYTFTTTGGIPVITNILTGYIGEYTIVNVPGCVNTIPYQLYTHMIFTHWMVTSATNPELITGWGTESYGRMGQVVTNGHAKGCKVLASLYHQPGSGLLEVIRSSSLRAQLVTNLVNLAINNNLDGIDIDIEDQEAYPPLNSTTVPGLQDIIIGDLYNALNPLGKIVTVASAWDRRNILISTASKLAVNQVMAYDMQYSPATGRLPVHANYVDSVAAMNLWINAGFPREKLVMGIPAYGKGGDGASVFWREIVPYVNPTDTQNTANVTSVPTGRTNSYPSGYIPIVGGVLWWNGIKMIQDKVAFIKAQGLGGTMIFDAGHDLPVNGMQQVIYDALNS